MAISYYAEVTRSKPAAKNKSQTKVGYDIRVFYKNDDVIQQMGGIGLFGNTDNYAKVSTYAVKDLSYGDMKTSSETGSYGTGAKFSVDVTPATSGTYTPGFYVEIYDPGFIGASLIGSSVKSALDADPSLLPVTFKIPTGGTVKIPTIQVTKATVAPNMPDDLKGRNSGSESGIADSCLGFQWDSCRKSWITIWKKSRYVNPKTNKVATAAEQSAILSGSGPKGYNKQFTYYIEAVTQKAYDDNPGKTLEQLRTLKIGVSRPYTAPGWDWASNNTPYDPPGTGPSMGSFKGATEEHFKKFINQICGDVPPVDDGAGPKVEKSTVLPTAGNNSNPPPHIVTRHFSPVADYKES